MKFKKVVSAVLVSALAVSMMAGCGSKSGSSDSKSDVFKIGGIGPMTGDAAAYGEAVDNGAKLAVEEINKNGGINGKQVEFKTEDDQADAEKAVNAYNTLKDWGMQRAFRITITYFVFASQILNREQNPQSTLQRTNLQQR